MNVAETIESLADLREEYGPDFTVEQCHAIGVALVVLMALTPSERDLIDALLAMPESTSN